MGTMQTITSASPSAAQDRVTVSSRPERLLSLDLFRGVTIAAMILVNDAGDGPSAYWPLHHAVWNGWTPTDLVFPFFLFIVGVAMAFSFGSRLSRGESRARLLKHVLWRGLILLALGMHCGAGIVDRMADADCRSGGLPGRILGSDEIRSSARIRSSHARRSFA